MYLFYDKHLLANLRIFRYSKNWALVGWFAKASDAKNIGKFLICKEFLKFLVMDSFCPGVTFFATRHNLF